MVSAIGGIVRVREIMGRARGDAIRADASCVVDAEATLAEAAAALAASGAPAATVLERGRAIGAVTTHALLAHWPHGTAAHRARSEPPSGPGFAEDPE